MHTWLASSWCSGCTSCRRRLPRKLIHLMSYLLESAHPTAPPATISGWGALRRSCTDVSWKVGKSRTNKYSIMKPCVFSSTWKHRKIRQANKPSLLNKCLPGKSHPWTFTFHGWTIRISYEQWLKRPGWLIWIWYVFQFYVEIQQSQIYQVVYPYKVAHVATSSTHTLCISKSLPQLSTNHHTCQLLYVAILCLMQLQPYPLVIKHGNRTWTIEISDVPMKTSIQFGEFPASHVWFPEG